MNLSKSHMQVPLACLNIWYNGLSSNVLNDFTKESFVSIKRWLKSWFDFRPFYLDCVWEMGMFIHTHTHTYLYLNVCICTHVYI